MDKPVLIVNTTKQGGMMTKNRLVELLEKDRNTLESLKNVLPMIEQNRVACDYLEKIIYDMQKDLEELEVIEK